MLNRSLIFTIVLLTSCAVHAWGAEFDIVPSFSAKEEYNDNIQFTQDDRIHDFITTLSPGLKVTRRIERMEADLSARIDHLTYAHNNALDATSYMYSGTASYQVNPLLSVLAQGGYTKSANPTLTPAATGIVTVSGALYHIAASASAAYQFTEKAMGTFSYDYGKDYYDNPQYLPDDTQNANAGLVYDLGRYLPRLKGRMNMGYSYYYYPGDRIDTARATIGFSRDIDEMWSIHLDAGVRRTWSEVATQEFVPSATIVINGDTIPIAYQSTEVAVSKGGWGAVGNVSLKYAGERTSGSLSYIRDISPVSGLNGAAETDSTMLSAQHMLTETLSVSLTLGYYLLRTDPSQFSTTYNKENQSTFNMALHYAFSRDTSLDASYDYSWVDYPVSGTKASRQTVSLRLSTQYPLFE